jgi:hypothetical protein
MSFVDGRTGPSLATTATPSSRVSGLDTSNECLPFMLTNEQNRAAVAITGVTHTDPPGNMRHLDTALAVIAHTALTPRRICELRSSHQSHPLPDGCFLNH